MGLKMIDTLKNILLKKKKDDLVYEHLVSSYIIKPEFPWLISFPRTGSHWLRMMMELYFEKPSLVRAFYYKNATDFTCYHTHDHQLDIDAVKNIIYLFRNPVDTVFSNLQYYKHNTRDIGKIKETTNSYSDHLVKWLIDEEFSENKTIISYEGLKNNLENEFKKITKFFNTEFDEELLKKVSKNVSKQSLKKKTLHDEKVVNLDLEYNNLKDSFREDYWEIIVEQLYLRNPKLASISEYQHIFKYEDN